MPCKLSVSLWFGMCVKLSRDYILPRDRCYGRVATWEMQRDLIWPIHTEEKKTSFLSLKYPMLLIHFCRVTICLNTFNLPLFHFIDNFCLLKRKYLFTKSIPKYLFCAITVRINKSQRSPAKLLKYDLQCCWTKATIVWTVIFLSLHAAKRTLWELSIMPNRPVRDQKEYSRKMEKEMERNFAIMVLISI